MTALNKELAPCPFCGDYGAEPAKSSVPDMRGGWKKAVYCNTCFGEGPPADDSDAAIEAWNRRSSTPKASALPVEGAGWMPFALTLATALDRGDEAALLMEENSPLRDELRRLIAQERAITSEKSTEVKEAERDCMFTPGHADFERRQTFTAPIVGSWPWLRGCINGIPKREEFLGGQRTRYVQLDEVLGWIDEGERRAAHTSPAIVGTPSKEGAGQVEAVMADDYAHYAIDRGADLLEGYADWIKRNVMSAQIEEHPYLPELEGVAEELRALSKLIATPPASPSEGGVEQIAHIKQAIYTISGGDFDATDDEARRIAEAVHSLSPSRGERTAHCGNDACNWKGPISECCYLGSIGPCCPECREICEPEPRGEAVDAAKELLRAVELEMSPEWECNSYHPAIAPAVERLKAAIQSQGAPK